MLRRLRKEKKKVSSFQVSEMSREEPRIGVFVCHCGLNIAGVVDCKAVAEYAKTLPNVVYARDQKYSCSDSAQEEMKKIIKEHNLNRVVVASCSPRLHEPTFRKMVEEVGLNKYLFEMANIREHVSWVHVNEPEKATEKAKDLVRMAVAKARLLEPLEDIVVPVEKACLVIGGGISGMRAALDLADMGFKVYLVEKEPSIGGVMAKLDKTFPTLDCSICIEGPVMSDVGKHENIELLAYHEVRKISGYIGNFEVEILKKRRGVSEECNGCGECEVVCPVVVPNEFDEGLGARKAIYKPFPQAVPNMVVWDSERCIDCKLCELVCERDAILKERDEEKTFTIKVGTIIVATGCKWYRPENNEYHYLDYPNVITALEFERIINASGPTQGKVVRPSDGKTPKRIGFVLCVGTRDRGKDSYCSGGVCCTYTLKLAAMLKEKDPKKEVYIYYIDMRSIGKGFEELYARCRERGVKFIRGKPGEVVEDPKTKNLIITVEDSLEGKVVQHELDLLILSTGAVPVENAQELARILNISRSREGFFLEKHPKLAPVDTPTDGVYICGTAQSPKDIPSSVAQARAAATAAAIPMIKGKINLEGSIAHHIYEKCTGCGLCVKACPYGAWSIDKEKKKAVLTPALCKGCGTCAAECPKNAIEMKHFTDEQIYAQIEAALEENPEDKILAILCNWCCYAGSDTAGVSRMQYPPNIRIIRVMCSGRVSTKFIEKAFDLGAGMVLVGGCHPGDCHYISGNEFMAKREKRIRAMLERKGIEQERFRLEWVSASEGARFQEVVKEMTAKLKELNAKK